MPDADLSFDSSVPLRRLALVVWMVALSAAGLAVVAACCWFLVPPLDTASAAFRAQYTVLDGFFYARQPGKSVAFEVCVLAAPWLIGASFFAVRTFLARLGAAGLRRAIGIGLAIHLLFFVACVRPVFYYPHPPLWLAPRWLLAPLRFPPPVPAWEWIGSIVAACAFCLWLGVASAGRRTGRVVWRLILVLAILLVPAGFFAPSEITSSVEFTYHLNAMLDALSQSVNGRHLLVDFPHIYGGYVGVMGPVLRLFPRTPGVLLAALAVPSVLALFCWLGAARLLIRTPVLLALMGFGLLAVIDLAAVPPTYVYTTARSFFPALGLLLAGLYFRRPAVGGYVAVSMAAALASIWNIDTGVVLWVAWTLTLLAGEAAARCWLGVGRHLAVQLVFLVVAWGAFVLYLRVASGAWPDPGLLFYFQSMVVESGYFCVALVVPSVWTFFVLLYLTGLVVAGLAHFRGRADWRVRMVLLLSLTGIGMFSYYMGRSAEPNLIAVCPPGILLAGLLADGVRARRRFLPSVTRWFLVPWLAMIFWWAFLFFAYFPLLLGRDAQVARAWLPHAATPFEADVAVVKTWVRPGECDVFFLSGHSGFYYYLTDSVRPLRVPGNVELLRMRDMEVVLAAIQGHAIPKLVVDENFFAMEMYRPEVYQALREAIAGNYRVAAVAPGGRVVLEVPR
jgi:hypothetical protein